MTDEQKRDCTFTCPICPPAGCAECPRCSALTAHEHPCPKESDQKRDLWKDLSSLEFQEKSLVHNSPFFKALGKQALKAWPIAIRRALEAETERNRLRAELIRVLTHVCHESCGCGDLVDGEDIPSCLSPCPEVLPAYELLRPKGATA